MSGQLVAEAATLQNTQQTQGEKKSMPSTGFEPAIPAIDGPQTYASDRTATGIKSDYNGTNSQ